MPISAEQWRAVVGSNNVKRPRQVDVKHCLVISLCPSGCVPARSNGNDSSIELSDSEGKSGLYSIQGQRATTDCRTCFPDFCDNVFEGAPFLVLVLMSVCAVCAQTLLFSDSVVTMLLLLMAGDVETNPGPAGIDTPEYQTIKECTNLLTTQLKSDLSTISDYLWQEDMIPETVRETLSQIFVSDRKRATILVDYVTDCIKNTPSYFQRFVSVVEKLGPWAEDMLKQLKETFAIKNKVSKPRLRSQVTDIDRRIDDIARHSGIDPGLLDLPCDKSHLLSISKEIVHWKAYTHYLGLPKQEENYIDTHPDHGLSFSKPKQMLEYWQKTQHAEPTQNHYRYLLKGIIEIEKNAQLVGSICEIIAADPRFSGVNADITRTKKLKEDSEERAPTLPQGFCTLPPSDESEEPTSDNSAISDVALAQVATDKLWPIKHGRDVLQVYFLNPIFLASLSLNTDNIMSWAKIWEHPSPSYSKFIPKFQHTSEKKTSNVRIQFVHNGRSWSKVGTDGVPVDMSKPTMVLRLYKGKTDYNSHVVMHEFGHILGLEHEHQRSVFWKIAKKFLDVEKMRKELGNRAVDYFELKQNGEGSMKYDPDSIMHYWFNKEWLKNKKYHKEDNIKADKMLSALEKNILLGIHRRHMQCADRPSSMDYEFLSSCYKKQYTTPREGPDFHIPPEEDVEKDNIARVSSNPQPGSGFSTSVINIGVIGATSSGKSTTINALLRGRYLPVAPDGMTAYVLCVKHNPSKPEGELYNTEKGSAPLAVGKEAICEKLEELNESRRDRESPTPDVEKVELELLVCIPFLDHLGVSASLKLYDTPGTSESKESQIYKDAKWVQDQMERLILVLSYDTLGYQETTDLLDRLHRRLPKLVDSERLTVLMNKWDKFFANKQRQTAQKKKEQISQTIKDKLAIDHIIFYSAEVGLEARCWQADFGAVDEGTFDDLKTKIRKIPGMEEQMEKFQKEDLAVKVKHLSEIAEEWSSVCQVEQHISSCLCHSPV